MVLSGAGGFPGLLPAMEGGCADFQSPLPDFESQPGLLPTPVARVVGVWAWWVNTREPNGCEHVAEFWEDQVA
eukprot:15434081-Alexandrium_andersonii.AAC.1